MKTAKYSLVLLTMMFTSLAVAKTVKTHFVTAGDVDWKSLATTAPAEDSAQTKDELKTLHELETTRTPEQVAHATAEVKLSTAVFSTALGSSFNPDDLPKTFVLLKDVSDDAKAVGNAAKDFYGRRRPYVVDPSLKPAVDLETSASFPSGHATRSRVMALVLCEFYPDKKAALLAVAKQVADDRVLAGVHFPSDVEAGAKLGDAIFTKLQESSEFKAALEAAKQEVTAHTGK